MERARKKKQGKRDWRTSGKTQTGKNPRAPRRTPVSLFQNSFPRPSFFLSLPVSMQWALRREGHASEQQEDRRARENERDAAREIAVAPKE